MTTTPNQVHYRRVGAQCTHDWAQMEHASTVTRFTESCRRCGARCRRDRDGSIESFDRQPYRPSDDASPWDGSGHGPPPRHRG